MEENNSEKIITRIAPSPTGVLHIGTVRTALFNYLFAKKNGGKFIIRIEDTDKERSRKEYEENIMEGFEFLGLKHDEFYRQSERTDIYEKYINEMIKNGSAYLSKEEITENQVSENDANAKIKRSEVIRFKNPNKEIVFNDLIRGEIKFDTTELGDFVIAKSTREPLYHLAVVIDDHEMNISHIIRGDDGISNTPRQILIQQAIGAKTPKYAHLPLILGKDRSKMSKRHGAVSISEFRQKGYLKEALINYTAFLGWNPKDERELFTMDELIQEFEISKISKSGAIFNIEKLDWYNKEYLKLLPKEEIQNNINKYLSIYNPSADFIKKISPIILERISKYSDIEEMIKNGELEYYFKKPELKEAETIQKIIWKKSDKEKTIIYLKDSINFVEKANENFNASEYKNLIWDYAEKNGKGDVLWPIRFALSGKDKSPDPFVLMELLGKNESLDRIKNAIDILTNEQK